jgi:hypothetical protein
MNPHADDRLHPELSVLAEVPDPLPQASTSHAWAECIAIAHLRKGRFSFYDGRRLHQQYVQVEDAPRLSKDPATGRLTMNSFFWAGP